MKHLGILIHKVLFWNNQTDDICTKLAQANSVLLKLHHFVPKSTCVSVYFSLFYSHGLYGCLVWSFQTQCNIDRLIKLQERCIHIFTYWEFIEHSGPLFSELKLLKVKDIFSLTKLLFMFDFVSKNVAKELKSNCH